MTSEDILSLLSVDIIILIILTSYHLCDEQMMLVECVKLCLVKQSAIQCVVAELFQLRLA